MNYVDFCSITYLVIRSVGENGQPRKHGNNVNAHHEAYEIIADDYNGTTA